MNMRFFPHLNFHMMESAPKKVCVIGNNTAGLVFRSDSHPEIGGKTMADEMVICAGGQGANAAFTLASLGLRVRYLGCFGGDNYGTLSRNSLLEANIDVSACPIVPNCPNQLSCIWVNSTDQERTILMHKDPRLSLKNLEPKSCWIDDCDALYIDGHEPLFSAKMAVLARERGIPVVADTEKVVPHSLELLKQTTAFIAPLRIILEISKRIEISGALEIVAEMGPPTVVATMGSDGSACFCAEGFEMVPASSCATVDTTGAGDVFHAAFVAAILSGRRKIREALEFASFLAALKCETRGTRLAGSSLEKAKDQMKAFRL